MYKLCRLYKQSIKQSIKTYGWDNFLSLTNGLFILSLIYYN